MPYYPPPSSGGGGPTPTPVERERKVASCVVESSGRDAPHVGRISLGRSYQLISIETDVPARVRLYVSPEGQAADLSRPAGAIIALSNGVILDFITSPDRLAWPLTPVVNGSSLESPPRADIPVTIQRTDQVGPVTLTLTYFTLEA